MREASQHMLCNELARLTQTFFEDDFIDHVNIIAKNSDGTVSYFCNNQRWIDLYFEKKYPLIGFFENYETPRGLSFLPWESLDPSDPILIDSKEMLNLQHGITFIRSSEETTYYYNLGKKGSDANILGNYLSQRKKLEGFIEYLNPRLNFMAEKSKKLLLCGNEIEVLESRSRLNGKLSYLPSNSDLSFLSKEHREFYRSLIEQLSPKQLDTLYFMASGFSMKMIANSMGAGFETVKTHVKQIRDKLDYSSTANMLQDCLIHKVQFQFERSKRFLNQNHSSSKTIPHF
jgi:DNA-binding CsgD family transcriptional regulator